MTSYHVFFSPKPGTDETHVVRTAQRFFAELKAAEKLSAYRILRVTDPGSFKELPRFQAIVDYASQERLDESFAFMRQPGKIHASAHGELLGLVADFKVSFSTDV